MDVLEFVYLVCFFLGLGFAVLSGLLAGVFTGHAGAHIDSVPPMDGGGALEGSHSAGDVHYSPLSPVTIAMFISTFGGVGILMKNAGFPLWVHIPVAAFSGIIVGGFVSWAFYRIMLATQASRSEEHTSELQSQSNLVCRLLLE